MERSVYIYEVLYVLIEANIVYRFMKDKCKNTKSFQARYPVLLWFAGVLSVVSASVAALTTSFT